MENEKVNTSRDGYVVDNRDYLQSPKCSELAEKLATNSSVVASALKAYNREVDDEVSAHERTCAELIKEKIAEVKGIKSAIVDRISDAHNAAVNFDGLLKMAKGTGIGYWGVNNTKPPAYGAPTSLYIDSIKTYLGGAKEAISLPSGISTTIFNVNYLDSIREVAVDIDGKTKYDAQTAIEMPAEEEVKQAEKINEDLYGNIENAKTENTNRYENFIKEKERLITDGKSPVKYNSSINSYTCPGYDNFDSNLPQIAVFGGEDGVQYTPVTTTTDPYTLGSEIDPQDPSGGGAPMTTTSTCYNTTGGLGWIACVLGDAGLALSQWLYGAIEPWARVSDSIVGQMIGISQSEGPSALYSSWATMRDIANILFVLLFLVVIFSQLTGFGIDNYGIKKILPKLIVTAILVNTSFFICAAVIDFSNVIGTSVQDFLIGISKSSTGFGAETGLDSLMEMGLLQNFMNMLSVFLGGGAIYAGVTAIRGIEIGELVKTIAWPLMIVLLTVIISLLFAFIVLGFRQALIIMLVILSPLAFACHILPNTESIYKKWFNLFKAMLIVYPVVGVLIGGGRIAGRLIMITTHTQIGALVGGVLEVVPYFLVPSLSRKAINTVDGLGTKLQGFGKRTSGFGKDKIENSDARKARKEGFAQQLAQARANRFLSSKRGKDIANRIAGGARVSTSESARYQKAMQSKREADQAQLKAYQAYLADDAYTVDGTDKYLEIEGKRAQISHASSLASNKNIVSESGYNAALAAIKNKETETAVSNYASQLRYGGFQYNGRTYTDSSNVETLSDILRSEKAKGSGADSALVTAVTNAMFKRDGGVAGIQISEILSDGARGEGDVTNRAIAKAALEQSGLKAKNFPLLDLASKIAEGGRGNATYNLLGNGGKFSAATFSEIDKELLNEQFKAVFNSDGTVKDSDGYDKLKAIYSDVAKQISNNPQYAGTIKSEAQWRILEAVTRGEGINWSDIRAGKLKVDHGGGGTES